jgi:hypothetical protein
MSLHLIIIVTYDCSTIIAGPQHRNFGHVVVQSTDMGIDSAQQSVRTYTAQPSHAAETKHVGRSG